MTCTFIGHRDAPNKIKLSLKEAILYVIEKERIEKFLVGNNGSFDFYAQCALRELKEERPTICFDIVLSRLDEKVISENQGETLFPAGLETALPKFAISKRNNWLINNSSILIAYAKYRISNSGKWLERASKKGLKIINLADENNKFWE